MLEIEVKNTTINRLIFSALQPLVVIPPTFGLVLIAVGGYKTNDIFVLIGVATIALWFGSFSYAEARQESRRINLPLIDYRRIEDEVFWTNLPAIIQIAAFGSVVGFFTRSYAIVSTITILLSLTYLHKMRCIFLAKSFPQSNDDVTAALARISNAIVALIVGVAVLATINIK